MTRDVFDFACIGDSLTTGYVSRNWTAEVAALLSLTTFRPVVCYDLGLPGMMSDWGLANIGSVIQLKPKAVTIAFGMNDSDPPLNMPLAQYAANMRAMILAIRANSPGTAIFLMTMNEIAVDSTNPVLAGRKANVAYYYDALRTVAREQGVGLIDNHPQWRGKTLADLSDGIHPDLPALRQITIPNVTTALKSLL
ncbi:hypothetical protein DC522_05960 [Microvirga sp. KLBC 81]|uniref:SGNH/GDSL hydrolase family protein n=1 Tax=Microvirga sp. KLBC 81 TaxID=1862707 RepID=UPI000D51691C|nr:SGNH/GDSL hydrolase family protein [Microvirga sp. KLBC 81]PVE25438.1 hypothetical protein DC522_05960 [Microvirga sp. KLBC 81]